MQEEVEQRVVTLAMAASGNPIINASHFCLGGETPSKNLSIPDHYRSSPNGLQQLF